MVKLPYTGGTLPPDVKFLRRGLDITTDSRALVRVDAIGKTVSMTIRSLKPEDQAMYTVQLTCGGKVCDTSTFNLKIRQS